MLSTRSVLIVDECEETRAVLRTALERQGTLVLEADSAGEGLLLAEQYGPAVVVLDLDLPVDAGQDVWFGFRRLSRQGDCALLLLASRTSARRTFPGAELLLKPYHYGPLVRKIESLLDYARQPLAQSA